MGAVKDAYETIYRDFAVPGVASSGRHEPPKVDIRAIGSLIEQLLTAAGVSGQIFPSAAAGAAATTNGQLFLVQGTGNSFASLYKNVAGAPVDQGISLPSGDYVEEQFAIQGDAIDLTTRLSQALAQSGPIPNNAIQTGRNTGGTLPLVAEAGTPTDTATTDGSYWTDAALTLTLGKYRNQGGAEATLSGLNYATYTLAGGDLEYRASGFAGSNVTPLATYYTAGGAFLAAQYVDLSDGAQLLGDKKLTLPATTAIIRINSAANAPITLRIRRAGVALVALESDAWGKARLPYTAKVSVNKPMILATASSIAIHYSHGQSWRSDLVSIPSDMFIGRDGDGRALTFKNELSNIILPPIGIDSFPASATEFANLNFGISANAETANGANIGWIAAQSLCAFRDRYRVMQRPVLDVSGAYPGQAAPALLPGGSVVSGSDTWHPWTTMLAYRDQAAVLATGYNLATHNESFSWTHGAYADGFTDSAGDSDYYVVMGKVLAAVDAALRGPGNALLPFFMDATAPLSSQTKAQDNILRQIDWAKANSRAYIIGPRYPYPFRDDTHHDGFGYILIGELEGYIKHLVIDRALEFSLNDPPYVFEGAFISNMAIVGTTLTTTVNAMQGFGALAIDIDLIEMAPQLGLHVRQGSTEIALSNFAIEGNTITATLATALATGVAYEASYAYRGPGSESGRHSGVWGNFKRVGPKSNWIERGPGSTVDSWVLPYKKTITGA